MVSGRFMNRFTFLSPSVGIDLSLSGSNCPETHFRGRIHSPRDVLQDVVRKPSYFFFLALIAACAAARRAMGTRNGEQLT